MKTLLLLAGAIVAGLCLGIGTSLLSDGLPRDNLQWQDLVAKRTLQRPQPLPPQGPQPRVEVDQEEFDFGVMESGTKQTHTFHITNRGSAPLELKKGSTSCTCTLSKFDQHMVQPGKTAPIVLEWTTPRIGSSFREIATIFTNDPRRKRLDLVVTGRLVQTLEIKPPEFLFGKLLLGAQKDTSVRILSHRDAHLKILDFDPGNTEASRFFSVAVAPIPPDQLEEKDAKSGVLVTVTVKPGLPMGVFHERLELKTNVGDHDTLRIPIEGRVTSDISIVGPGWDGEQGIVSFGKVSNRVGAKRKLMVFVRGKNAGGIELRIVSKSPDFLRVKLGEKTTIQGGRVVKVPLTVEIPPGVGPISRLGTQQSKLGKILVETNHARTKQLRLLVRFVVK